ncbi:hypothetical protein EIP86_001789 [Pleurotus ostreatoroseus]|nr:hypothetical protein EIP86_001789 [Pleurotus ostreatoroseus]
MRRYRLMLRRCLATPHPCFGMIPQRPPSAGETDGFEYGTMLEIRNVQILPDGRSVVETWGSYRFRIMERGVLDGYVVGRIERVDDFEEELEVESQGGQPKLDVEAAATARVGAEEKRGEASEAGGDAEPGAASVPRPVPAAGRRAPTNQELIQICQDFVRELRDGTPWVNQSISNYVEMPTDPVAFTWWMAPLIPIEDKTKAKLLPIRSPRLRLRLIVHWIEQLRSQW